jgi:hypothetical protein
MVASTMMMFFDPYINWAGFVVYDPRELHLPSSWAYVSLAPNIEPLFSFLGYPFYLMIPGLIALAIYRRKVKSCIRPDGWIARHEVLFLFAFPMPFAIAFDFIAELSMVRTELWTYVQAVGPVIHIGSQQWPILVEPLLFAPTMAVTAAMLLPDRQGQTMTHRTAKRIGVLRQHPVFGPITVAVVVYAGLYAGLYGGTFSILHMTGAATHLNTPVPYQEQKIYDPQGKFEHAGIPGPYYAGRWSGQW